VVTTLLLRVWMAATAASARPVAATPPPVAAATPSAAVAAQIARAFPGWNIDVAVEGDLNGDALPDVVATLKRPEAKEGESGEAEREAWLAVFLRAPDGQLRLHTKAARAVCLGCGGAKSSWSDIVGVPTIDAKGILTLTYEGGSREMWSHRLKWRLDKRRNHFALIGDTFESVDTLVRPGKEEPGFLTYQDINYLRGKMIRKVARQGRQTCDVTPGLAADDLATFDFQQYVESEDRQVEGSCHR
jgi:hypothetical protein